MSETKIRHIWNPSTGITDLEDDSKGLAATEIPGIRATWRDQRELLQGTKLLHDFNERLGREWAIETGIIENLYEVERDVTQTLIEQGVPGRIAYAWFDESPEGVCSQVAGGPEKRSRRRVRFREERTHIVDLLDQGASRCAIAEPGVYGGRR